MPTLLAVLAHPDDESFGLGGTLAYYASRGVSVHLACATRGEAGEVALQYLQGFGSIAALREQELACAADVLGLAGVHYLGYRDSGMTGSADNAHPQALVNQPLDEVTAQIVGCIRSLKPQVVVTFDSIGGYRHPDHIAIHLATVAAFHAAGKADQFPEFGPPHQPERLYFHTFPRTLLRWTIRLMPLLRQDPKRWGRNRDIDLTSLIVDNIPVHARIDFSSVQEKKTLASSCHASQGGAAATRGLTRWFYRMAGAKEFYMRGYPPAPPKLRETDFFEGLDGAG